MKFFFFSLLLLASPWAHAPLAHADDEIMQLYEGPREEAMGGACTAIAEGEEAVYLNPAAMAGNRGMGVGIPLSLQTSKDTVSELQGSATAFNNINSDSINQLMGKDIYARGTASPTLLLPNVGFSVLVDDQFALLAKNLSAPDVTLGVQQTNGFQFATGFSVLRSSKRSRDDLRVGLGFKMMWRRGGYEQLTTQQIFNLSESEVKSMIGDYGEGMSGDLGLQYSHKVNNRFKLLAGLDYAQIGGMQFSGGGQAQPADLSIGAGAAYMLNSATRFTLAYDIKNLTQSVEFEKRNHFGMELKMPLISVDFGLNEGTYLGGGVGVDLVLLKIWALTYEEELGEYSGQEGERRYMLSIEFKLGS